MTKAVGESRDIQFAKQPPTPDGAGYFSKVPRHPMRWSIVLAIAAAFVIWMLIQAGPWLRSWQERRAGDALRQQAEERLRSDKYGGKTPEETFDLFIAALEKGDIELASKYFVVQKQDGWSKTLAEYNKKALLSDFILELVNNKKSWKLIENKNNIAKFEYSYKVTEPFTEKLPLGDGRTQELTHPAGDFKSEILFEKYPNVWKISVL